jgi:hypothetical protein
MRDQSLDFPALARFQFEPKLDRIVPAFLETTIEDVNQQGDLGIGKVNYVEL